MLLIEKRRKFHFWAPVCRDGTRRRTVTASNNQSKEKESWFFLRLLRRIFSFGMSDKRYYIQKRPDIQKDVDAKIRRPICSQFRVAISMAPVRVQSKCNQVNPIQLLREQFGDSFILQTQENYDIRTDAQGCLSLNDACRLYAVLLEEAEREWLKQLAELEYYYSSRLDVIKSAVKKAASQWSGKIAASTADTNKYWLAEALPSSRQRERFIADVRRNCNELSMPKAVLPRSSTLI